MLKDLLLEVAQDIPQNATLEEIIDELIVRASAIKGFTEVEDGKYSTQEELLEEIKKW